MLTHGILLIQKSGNLLNLNTLRMCRFCSLGSGRAPNIALNRDGRIFRIFSICKKFGRKIGSPFFIIIMSQGNPCFNWSNNYRETTLRFLVFIPKDFWTHSCFCYSFSRFTPTVQSCEWQKMFGIKYGENSKWN